MGCVFRCRVLHRWLGVRTPYSFMQVSHIGYCDYFHMSRANKLHELRRGRKYFPKRSSKAKYYFFRCSSWPKMKREWKSYDGLP